MKFVLFQLFILLTLHANAQTMKEIDLAFANKKYEEVLLGARQLVAKEPGNAYPYGITGSVYVQEAKYDSSLPYLRKAIELDNDSTYISGWAHVNLGNAYVYLGAKDKGIAELRRGVTLNTWGNSAKAGRHMLDSLGYPMPEKSYPKNYLPTWVRIEGEHIIYKFQDTAGITSAVYKFIQQHEDGYTKLNQTFAATLPTKLTIHVWNDAAGAKRILSRQTGFTYLKQCFSHVSRQASVGYDIAQVLAYWSGGTESTGYSKFMYAGIGICFNLTEYDRYANARKIAGKYDIKGVLKVWENEKDYDGDVLFPIAGAFVTYLQQHSTPEQFRQIIKQQTIANARVIYGSQFDSMIKDFDGLMGMKG